MIEYMARTKKNPTPPLPTKIYERIKYEPDVIYFLQMGALEAMILPSKKSVLGQMYDDLSYSEFPYFTDLDFEYQLEDLNEKEWKKRCKKYEWSDDIHAWIFKDNKLLDLESYDILSLLNIYEDVIMTGNFDGYYSWNEGTEVFYGGYLWPKCWNEETNADEWTLDFDTNPDKETIDRYEWKKINDTMVAVYDKELDLDLMEPLSK